MNSNGPGPGGTCCEERPVLSRICILVCVCVCVCVCVRARVCKG